MRGSYEDQGHMFSYMTMEERVPADHPLRKIRELVREVLASLDKDFRKLYAHEGRPSIPPEQLLSALLLQVFFGVRSERLLMEQMGYTRRPSRRTARDCSGEIFSTASWSGF